MKKIEIEKIVETMARSNRLVMDSIEGKIAPGAPLRYGEQLSVIESVNFDKSYVQVELSDRSIILPIITVSMDIRIMDTDVVISDVAWEEQIGAIGHI